MKTDLNKEPLIGIFVGALLTPLLLNFALAFVGAAAITLGYTIPDWLKLPLGTIMHWLYEGCMGFAIVVTAIVAISRWWDRRSGRAGSARSA